jgi:hypothetical protein
MCVVHQAEAPTFNFILDARWMPLTMFDPLKIAHKVKDVVAHQFCLSNTSRIRVLLVARLMNTLVNRWVLDEQGVSALGLLRDSILGSIMTCSLQYPISEQTRRQASGALDNLLEVRL